MTLEARDHAAVVRWATAVAEHVLPIYEKAHPRDPRPRRAIDGGRAWMRGDLELRQLRAAALAAHAAARATDDEAARAAARAAGQAAATGHAAGHAPAASAYAVDAVICAARDPETAASAERAWQVRRLPRREAARAVAARWVTRRARRRSRR